VAEGRGVGDGGEEDGNVGHLAEDGGAQAVAFDAVGEESAESWSGLVVCGCEVFAELRT